MKKQNPVIKNYIYSSKTRILEENPRSCFAGSLPTEAGSPPVKSKICSVVSLHCTPNGGIVAFRPQFVFAFAKPNSDFTPADATFETSIYRVPLKQNKEFVFLFLSGKEQKCHQDKNI